MFDVGNDCPVFATLIPCVYLVKLLSCYQRKRKNGGCAGIIIYIDLKLEKVAQIFKFVFFCKNRFTVQAACFGIEDACFGTGNDGICCSWEHFCVIVRLDFVSLQD